MKHLFNFLVVVLRMFLYQCKKFRHSLSIHVKFDCRIRIDCLLILIFVIESTDIDNIVNIVLHILEEILQLALLLIIL